MLSPHRRQPLLARALRRARRVSRAHSRGDAAPDRDAARLWRRQPTNGNRRWRPPAARRRFFAAHDEANEETVTEFLAFSTGQPVVDPQLLRGRAHQCARGAHRAHHGDVGGDQRRLARAQALRQPAGLARGVRALPALGAGILAALRRLGLPHDAAQRRLLVLAARRVTSSAPTTPRASST